MTDSTEFVLLVYRTSPCLPVAGATVTLSPGGRWAITDAAGVARFRNLAPGEYLAQIKDAAGWSRRVALRVGAGRVVQTAVDLGWERPEVM